MVYVTVFSTWGYVISFGVCQTYYVATLGLPSVRYLLETYSQRRASSPLDQGSQEIHPSHKLAFNIPPAANPRRGCIVGGGRFGDCRDCVKKRKHNPVSSQRATFAHNHIPPGVLNLLIWNSAHVGSVRILLLYSVGTFLWMSHGLGAIQHDLFSSARFCSWSEDFMASLSTKYRQLFLVRGIRTGLGNGLILCPAPLPPLYALEYQTTSPTTTQRSMPHKPSQSTKGHTVKYFLDTMNPFGLVQSLAIVEVVSIFPEQMSSNFGSLF